VTVVIIVAAIGALVLFISILALSRSRFADESERFRYVSDLTSQWSQQQASKRAARTQPAASTGTSQEGEAPESAGIDLRDVRDPEHQSSRSGQP
jgi:hypothetical protein